MAPRLSSLADDGAELRRDAGAGRACGRERDDVALLDVARGAGGKGEGADIRAAIDRDRNRGGARDGAFQHRKGAHDPAFDRRDRPRGGRAGADARGLAGHDDLVEGFVDGESHETDPWRVKMMTCGCCALSPLLPAVARSATADVR